jgi:hypothetical protein
MNFNKHSELHNLHAFLSPSNYHWLNYTDDKLRTVFNNHVATERGTQLHDLAERLISLGVKLPKSKKTLNMYVNDAIGFKMTPEQPLYYSENCFGTADTISFKKNFLRIHDLKTGSIPASMHQLEIYAALFCLEYKMNPNDIGIELRIYQSDQVLVHQPDPEQLIFIIGKIIDFDKIITEIRSEE